MSTQSSNSFVSVAGVARWTKVLLIVTLGISLVGAIFGISQIELIYRAVHEGVSDSELNANDSRQQLIGLIQVLITVGTAVAFLMWFHHVHRNLSSLGGREFKFTPRWAVGGFFVPLINLVRPFEVMREVWHGSDPSGLTRDTGLSGPSERDKLGGPPLVVWWWWLFLISSFLGYLALRVEFSENQTIDYLYLSSGLMVLMDLVDIAGVVVAVRLVSHITKWQGSRAEQARMIGVGAPGALGYTLEN